MDKGNEACSQENVDQRSRQWSLKHSTNEAGSGYFGTRRFTQQFIMQSTKAIFKLITLYYLIVILY